jgi:hypothetical protein
MMFRYGMDGREHRHIVCINIMRSATAATADCQVPMSLHVIPPLSLNTSALVRSLYPKYVCVCTVYVYVYVCIYIYIYIHIYILYIYLCVYVYIYIYIVYIFVCVCIYIYMCVCMYVYIYLCMYVYIYINTNKQDESV